MRDSLRLKENNERLEKDSKNFRLLFSKMFTLAGLPRNEITIPILNSLGQLDEYPGWLIEENILNPMQKIVCTLRYNNVSYEKIHKLTGITSPNTITRIIKLTATSRIWHQGQQGGSYSLISDVTIKRLKNKVTWSRQGLNCMKTFEAKEFILDEVNLVQQRAVQRLREWKSQNLIQKIENDYNDFELTNSIFTTITEKCGIYVLSGEKLELLRRKCCNHPAIDSYFNLIEYKLLGVERKYLFNADETGLCAKRTFKVLSDDKTIHVTLKEVEGQHISCMCCFSAAGCKMNPFFIFPQRASELKELADIPDIFVSSSKNGWMTGHLWDLWSICFASFISIKRAVKELEIDKPVILFVDGHLSRMSPFGMRVLARFGIIVIIFPSHCSHVLQPFDVNCGAPLKIDYLKELARPLVIAESQLEGLTKTEIMRRRRVIAFINAWSKRSPSNLRSAFAQTGIFPFDKEALVHKDLISDPTADQMTTSTRLCPLSGKIATDNINLLPDYKWRTIENGRFVIKDIQPDEISAEMIILEWLKKGGEDGKIFNDLPSIFENGVDILH